MAPSEESLRYLRDLVYRRSAIVIESEKNYLLESRLGPILRHYEMDSLNDLVRVVRADERSPLCVEVVEAMTTNETSFFRDAHPFEALRTKVLPALIAARSGSRTLNIWCAASSTGQEPYSIAMAIRESFPELLTWKVRILATDINTAVLARARAGRYKQLEVNRGLPAAMLVKYFDRTSSGDWQIKNEIRTMVSFQELNLLDRWPLLEVQDIVFIRNVLIYFDAPTKRTLLGRLRELVKSDGYLILGSAETTLNLDEGYSAVRVGSSVFYQPKPSVGAKITNDVR